MIKNKIEIGEKILIADNIISFGTRPGALDRMLGEEDVRTIIIGEERVDRQSDEYKSFCETACDDFIKKFQKHGTAIDEPALEMALKNVDEAYNVRLKEAEEGDNVNWYSVFSNSLMLGSTLTDFSGRIHKDSDIELRSDLNHDISRDSVVGHSERDLESSTLKKGSLSEFAESKFKVSDDNSWNYLNDVPTFNDAIDFLNKNSVGIPHSMLMFGMGMSLSQDPSLKTLGIATAILSSIPENEAVKVGDKDYKTTVYCGPDIICEGLIKFAQDNTINLVEFDKKKTASSKDPKVERLIINTHGVNGRSGRLITEEQEIVRADDFTNKFFPNSKIIHTFGCSVGIDVERNYGKNNLKKNQILFLHSGNQTVMDYAVDETIPYLLSHSNQYFPIPEPLHIIVKEDESSSIITSIIPTSLEEIGDFIHQFDRFSRNKVDMVNGIYDLISDGVSKSKSSVLKKLENTSTESQNIIKAELERLGFNDHMENDIEVKEAFVKQYIAIMLMVEQNKTQPYKIRSYLGEFLQYDLIDINHKLKLSGTMSCYAAQEGDIPMLRILAMYGADFNKPDHEGRTPIFFASKNGQTKALEILLKNGADPNNSRNDGVAPIFMATKNGDTKSIKLLLESGADPNKAIYNGVTPLILAAEQGYCNSIKALIKGGANVNQAKNDGTTPLLISSIDRDFKSMKTLLEAGANVDQARNDGANPLLISSQLGDVKAVELLLEKGANPNLTIEGDSIAAIISNRGNHEVLRALAKGGADLNKFNNDGVTPLLFAIKAYKNSGDKKFKDNIICLIQNGANPELETPFGTAYEFSSDNSLNKEMKKHRDQYLELQDNDVDQKTQSKGGETNINSKIRPKEASKIKDRAGHEL